MNLITKTFNTDFTNLITITETLKISTENEELLYLESVGKNDVAKLTEEELNVYNDIKSNGAFRMCIDISEKFPTDQKFYEIYNNNKKVLTKQLYEYQIDALRTMFYLESMKRHKNVISNGYQLGLPIGSGKSIVFTTYALMFEDIPCHDIIISLSGKDIPEETIDHRFITNINYYEKVGYYVDQEPVVMELTDYKYRNLTIIITHEHLMNQMKKYIQEDYTSAFIRSKNIRITKDVDKISSTDNLVILMYSTENMKKLRTLGFNKPFKRIILDDYVLMPNIEECLQIPATMTWFISGNGYLRSRKILSRGYYSLMFSPFKDITIMGDPKKTLQGIMRNNIFCANLECYNTEFSIYKFIDENKSLFNKADYKPLTVIATSHDYLMYKFISNNADAIRNQIKRIEIIINREENNLNTQYYNIWKSLNAFIFKGIDLEESLLLNESVVSLSDSPVVNQKCYHCHNDVDKTNNWGLISTCCGAFSCEQCLKAGLATLHAEVVDHVEVRLFKINGGIYLFLKNRFYFVTNDIKKISIDSAIKYEFKLGSEVGRPNDIYDEVYAINPDTKSNVRLKYYEDKLFTILNETINIQGNDNLGIRLDKVRCTACNQLYPKFILNCMKKKDTSIKSMELVKGVVNIDEIESINNKKDLLSNNNIFELIFFMLLNGFTLKITPSKSTSLTRCLESKDNIGLKVISSIMKIIDQTGYNIQDESQIIIYGVEPHIQDKINEVLMKMERCYPRLYNNGIRKIKVMVTDSLRKLIGLQTTIIALICWSQPSTAHDQSQLIGRLLRIGPTNPYYFYINLIDEHDNCASC